MNKILFVSDLDNTLIHSYKKKREGDRCIEWIHDKEQGFMNEWSHGQAAGIINDPGITFVPVTTRSIEQYMRIHWKDGINPEYAVTTNGAILLANGETDTKWLDQSRGIAGKYRKEMEALLKELEEEGDYIRCRMVDEMYLFSYCKEGIDIEGKVDKYAARTDLNVISAGKKIYFLPPDFNKGKAVLGLRDIFDPSYIIAAGDSDIDIPMLEAADAAFCAKEIESRISNPNKFVFKDEKDLLSKVMEKVEACR